MEPATGPGRVRWLDAAALTRLLPPSAAISAVGAALRQERSGEAMAPLRDRLELGATVLMTMPAGGPDGLGVKVLTLTAGDRSRGRPAIQGVMLVFDGGDGRLRGAVDGPHLTALRTAALAGWATAQLADPAASHLVLAGAGAQAAHQVAAVCAVRPIRRVTLWNRTRRRAEELAAQLESRHPRLVLAVADDLAAATADADVVTLATSATSPLLGRADLPERCHVNALGAHEPTARELASDVLAAAAVFADTLAGCLAEAGDLLIPIAEGRLARAKVRPLADAQPGAGPLTVMKSVGSGVFDLACAAEALRRAESDGTGRRDAGRRGRRPGPGPGRGDGPSR
ncbi:MAG TPA: ornithine cyclodeaminase family protein [Candidatus Micrarchaeia archaeon]|nr:ornithine cyclodeaminase family protein [Candidatus Micrarchaeia archaeon]